MTSADREQDDRFASGEWTGFYMQPDSRQRFVMEFAMAFQRGWISGEGVDIIGRFLIDGAYTVGSGTCSWTKQYIDKHSVDYEGLAREGGIIGEWTIAGQPEFWSGPFFVWPRARGDLRGVFERAFVEYELTVKGQAPSFDAADL